jgi:hypothetical protein
MNAYIDDIDVVSELQVVKHCRFVEVAERSTIIDTIKFRRIHWEHFFVFIEGGLLKKRKRRASEREHQHQRERSANSNARLKKHSTQSSAG